MIPGERDTIRPPDNPHAAARLRASRMTPAFDKTYAVLGSSTSIPTAVNSAEEIVIERSLQLRHDRSCRDHEVTGHGGKAHRGRTRNDGGGKGAAGPGPSR